MVEQWITTHIQVWNRILNDKMTSSEKKVECLRNLTRLVLEEIAQDSTIK